MSLLLVIGGVPQTVYDAVAAEVSRGEKSVVCVGVPLRTGGHAGYWRETPYGDALLAKVVKTFRGAETFVEGCAIALVLPPHELAELAGRAAPYVPCFQIPILPPGEKRKHVAEFKNKVATEIRAVIRRMKAAMPIIRHEISSRANKTPFLLPPISFHSRSLPEHFQSVGTTLVDTVSDMTQVLKDVGDAIVCEHPPRSLGHNPQRYFVDNRGVYFVPPGSARHGLVRDGAGDTVRCEVGAHCRFGARYAPEFHYDCCQGSNGWRHNYPNCHGQGHTHNGSHVNIAPNERARA